MSESLHVGQGVNAAPAAPVSAVKPQGTPIEKSNTGDVEACILGHGTSLANAVLKTTKEVIVSGTIHDTVIEAPRVTVKPGGVASGKIMADQIIIEGVLENAVVTTPELYIVDTATVSNCEFNVTQSSGCQLAGDAKLWGKVTFNMPSRPHAAPAAG